MGRNNGVPVGYGHDWQYRGRWMERKTRPGQWKFRFRAIKGRTYPTEKYGSLKKGAKVKWRIHATQAVIKQDRNHYRTVMYGHKHLVSAKR